MKIGNNELSFVFRHKWDNIELSKPRHASGFKEYRLGIRFKREKKVGLNVIYDKRDWDSKLVNKYTFGVDLLIVKIWITYNKLK